MFPSLSRFFFKTTFDPTVLLSAGNRASTQVPISCKVSISDFIPSFHFALSADLSVSISYGSSSVLVNDIKTLKFGLDESEDSEYDYESAIDET
jgi:hypothetical protein